MIEMHPWRGTHCRTHATAFSYGNYTVWRRCVTE